MHSRRPPLPRRPTVSLPIKVQLQPRIVTTSLIHDPLTPQPLPSRTSCPSSLLHHLKILVDFKVRLREGSLVVVGRVGGGAVGLGGCWEGNYCGGDVPNTISLVSSSFLHLFIFKMPKLLKALLSFTRLSHTQHLIAAESILLGLRHM